MDFPRSYASSKDSVADIPIADPFDLCTNCRDIDFGVMFDTSLSGSLRYSWKIGQQGRIDLLSQAHWKSSCPLCHFFQEMAGPGASSAFLKSVVPYIISNSTGKRETAFFRVLPNGLDTPTLPLVTYVADGDDLEGSEGHNRGYLNRVSGRIVLPMCDFGAALNWLVECLKNHSGECNLQSERVTGLTAIDCNRRAVVSMPQTADYATLSYVWGTPQSEEIDPLTGLPAELPAVVSDAMDVASCLGLDYIWVDRYCIPQNDVTEKQRQIQLMGLIYANSFLTIIDASGSDAAAGLSGMGFPRRRQPCINVGGYKLVSTLSPAKVEIEESTWATRGWTYQEGQLARRRLLFTPQQTYFQCQRAHGCESIAVTFPDALDERVPPGMFDPYFSSKHWEPTRLEYGGAKPIIDGITTYMARVLTFPSDRLDSFAAMLRDYETVGGVVKGHLVGVPLLTPRFQGGSGHSTRTQQLLAGLSWYLDGARADGRWPLRYSCFPSWSWVAWRWTPVGARFRFDFGGIREITEMAGDTLLSWVGISVKFCDSEVVTWETGECRMNEKVGIVAIECIRFDAWTFDVGEEKLPTPTDDDSHSQVTNATTLQEYQLKGLIIGYRSFRGRITTLIALECGRLKGSGGGHWHRVSHGQLYVGLRNKKDPIKFHSSEKATAAARIIPWQRWKSDHIKLKREVLDLY